MEYRALCLDGAELALRLCNALTTAERLDCHPVHWGVLEHDLRVQARSRARAWSAVQRLRRELMELVEVEMPRSGPDPANLELKREIALKLCRGKQTQGETLALLAMWSA